MVETTDDEVILSRTEELIIELAKQKTAKGEITNFHIHTLFHFSYITAVSLLSISLLSFTISLTHFVSSSFPYGILVGIISVTGVSVLFFAVVNIVSLHSTLLMCGDHERSLARSAFPG